MNEEILSAGQETPGEPQKIVLGEGEEYSPEEIRAALKSRENEKKWRGELSRKGEEINSQKALIDKMEKLQSMGVNVDELLSGKAASKEDFSLPKIKDEESVGEWIDRVTSIVQQHQQEIAGLKAERQQEVQERVKERNLEIRDQFQTEHGLNDEQTSELIKFMLSEGVGIINHGTTSRPLYGITRKGIENAFVLMRKEELLADGKKSALDELFSSKPKPPPRVATGSGSLDDENLVKKASTLDGYKKLTQKEKARLQHLIEKEGFPAMT